MTKLFLGTELSDSTEQVLKKVMGEEIKLIEEYKGKFHIKLGVINNFYKSKNVFKINKLPTEMIDIINFTYTELETSKKQIKSISEVITLLTNKIQSNIDSTKNNSTKSELEKLLLQLHKLVDNLTQQEQMYSKPYELKLSSDKKNILNALIREEGSIIHGIESSDINELSKSVNDTRNNNNTITIEPLSKITLNEAIQLVNKVFPHQGMEPAWLAFKASLGIFPYNIIVKRKIDMLKYWVAVINGKVIGVTGIYTYKNDNEAIWGGWTCIEPTLVGSVSRAGGLLFMQAYNEAKLSGRKYLRVYSSDAPGEVAANKIYDKYKFEVTKTEKEVGSPYTLRYLQLEL